MIYVLMKRFQFISLISFFITYITELLESQNRFSEEFEKSKIKNSMDYTNTANPDRIRRVFEEEFSQN